jgi:ribosome maturation factor RimP
MKTRQPIEGQRNFRGRLLGVEGNDILSKTEQWKVRIPLDIITKANLEVDVSEDLRRGGR